VETGACGDGRSRPSIRAQLETVVRDRSFLPDRQCQIVNGDGSMSDCPWHLATRSQTRTPKPRGRAALSSKISRLLSFRAALSSKISKLLSFRAALSSKISRLLSFRAALSSKISKLLSFRAAPSRGICFQRLTGRRALAPVDRLQPCQYPKAIQSHLSP
jgi:hypothetical protein